MPPSVLVETVHCFSDPRGLVFEPATPEELPAQANVHLTLTAPGCVRGNHVHSRGHEITVVLGPALARFLDGTELRDVLVPAGQVYRFLIPPGVPHAFQNTGDSPMILLGFNTQRHNPSLPDTTPHLLIPPPA